MIAVQNVGTGLSGCVRYVMGEGRDTKTRQTRPAAANENESRVAWMSAQGFGAWTPQNRADIDRARRQMEYDALHQSSKTKPCKDDCFHLVLSWRTEENPSRAEMEQAAKEALAALGMGKAKALFIAHRDTAHAHLHIVASRINPETGYAFDNWQSKKKLQQWAHQWELRHGPIQCPAREKRGQLQAAIEERDAAAVLELLTQRQATFTSRELDRTLRPYLTEPGEAAAFRTAILACADVLALHNRESGERLDLFTTQDVRRAELAALEHAAALAAAPRHGCAAKAQAAALASRPTMREEQRKAFAHATGAAGLALIDGKAGTGKSYSMGAIRAAYEAEGRRVIGLAPTNAVAQDMGRDGFGEARTLHSALFALKNERDAWDRKTVIMVDEAAMIGTRLLSELLAQARTAGAKVILVGDDRQLASLERGGLFAELRERFGAASLTEVTRQRHADHKAAAEMLARGAFADAVATLDKLDCITRRNHQSESLTALVEQWKADSAAAPDKSRFVFAYTNADVRHLNAALRSVRKERGELGRDHEFTTTDGKAAFAEGDRLVFTATDKRQGIINGAFGTVEKIEGTKISLRLDADKSFLTFDAEQMQGFRHAYAGTIYKGQGRTFDDVYLYHSAHWKDAASYVALTRHRETVKLFVSTEVTRDTADLARQMARHEERRASVAFATAQEPPAPAEETRQPKPEASPIRTALARLSQFVREITGREPTPARPSKPGRGMEAQETAPSTLTASSAPLSEVTTGRTSAEDKAPAPEETPIMPLPLLSVALAATADPELVEGLAATIREGVADVAKAVAPAPAPEVSSPEKEDAPSAAPPPPESTFERAKRLAEAARAAHAAENARDAATPAPPEKEDAPSAAPPPQESTFERAKRMAEAARAAHAAEVAQGRGEPEDEHSRGGNAR